MGGEGGCERRIEFFVKIQKETFRSGERSGRGWGSVFFLFDFFFFFFFFFFGGGGVRVDLNEELSFCEN